jgi:transcriptional regulator with XRE-family HTH domain
MKAQKYYSKVLKEIGSNLADLRQKNGYATLKEFAQKHDLPEIQYWRMEKGKANITLKSLVKILSIHKVSLQDFFCLLSAEQKVH